MFYPYLQWRRENIRILDVLIEMDHTAARAIATRPAEIHAKNIQRNVIEQRASYIALLRNKLKDRKQFFG